MYFAGRMAAERWTEQPADTEERRLVRAALEGQRSAFDLLVQRHTPQVTSVVRRFVSDPNEQSDVVQETFVRAYESLRGFRGEASLRTWFVRIAINLCRRRRLTFWARRVVVTDDAGVLASAAGDPQKLAELAHLRDAVALAIAELPERLRLPLVLHVFEGLTGAEVAAVLGCNPNTAWSRIYAAQRQLRQKLAGLDD